MRDLCRWSGYPARLSERLEGTTEDALFPDVIRERRRTQQLQLGELGKGHNDHLDRRARRSRLDAKPSKITTIHSLCI
ncbi:hypothetical protein M404DRAFT_277042 [Pisolithus tinctorius Marx 270]|uniref:Uncharacterized protein n=1 Tax=Pisolithus tinctorius Marx 270 TaxID=870435 RepID=A0A0C3PMN6_PISTI|nr:hypothetical protein M404DRAFT_277042 [Pisolithus tinctorius Marx 270]